jgi:hypothetical protein
MAIETEEPNLFVIESLPPRLLPSGGGAAAAGAPRRHRRGLRVDARPDAARGPQKPRLGSRRSQARRRRRPQADMEATRPIVPSRKGLAGSSRLDDGMAPRGAGVRDASARQEPAPCAWPDGNALPAAPLRPPLPLRAVGSRRRPRESSRSCMGRCRARRATRAPPNAGGGGHRPRFSRTGTQGLAAGRRRDHGMRRHASVWCTYSEVAADQEGVSRCAELKMMVRAGLAITGVTIVTSHTP